MRFIRRSLKIGLVGFGGGSVLIPLLEREFVQGAGTEPKSFVQNTIIANITPGALPVKIAALCGLGSASSLRIILGVLAMALPGTIVTVTLLALISGLSNDAVTYIEYASVGIAAFILFLLLGFVYRVISPARRLNWTALAITLAAYIATGTDRTLRLIGAISGHSFSADIVELNALQLIVSALALIACLSLIQRFFPASVPTLEPSRVAGITGITVVRLAAVLVLTLSLSLAILLLIPGGTAFFGLMLDATLSAATSFGGGEAYVGVADSYFVETGTVSQTAFYGQIVPIANALPGPILIKIASGVAFSATEPTLGVALGLLVSLLAMIMTASISVLIALILFSGFGKLSNSRFIANTSKYMMPVVCGLLLSTAVSLVSSSASIAASAGLNGSLFLAGIVGLVLLATLLHRMLRVHDIVLVLAFGIISTIGLLGVRVL